MFGFSSPYKKTKKAIEESNLFDAVYYLSKNRDARLASETPLDHYCKVGIKEDRVPNAEFDPKWYREYYSDVANDTYYPFFHYVKFGLKEGRFQNETEAKNLSQLSSKIDFKSYEFANEDVAKMIKDGKLKNAQEHFLKFGLKEVQEGRRRLGLAFPYYDEAKHLELNSELANAVNAGELESGFVHLLTNGYEEFFKGERVVGGKYPFELSGELKEKLKKLFNEKSYLEANSDIQEALEKGKIKSAWEHFENFGIWEIRDGLRSIGTTEAISELQYISAFKDVRDALKDGKLNSAYEHFLLIGRYELEKGERKLSKSQIYTYTQPMLTDEMTTELETFAKKPLISIVMPVYNVQVEWLKAAINSIESQWYKNWELCIADDKSTKEET
ncbi:MAG: glycosyltransferase, partial [Campylobacterota bacterium]|nr:glycosyltransferase [Campylobacterota bacterium]